MIRDWPQFTGKYVEVTIKRGPHARHSHRGVFIGFCMSEICLRVDDGRELWIAKPNQFYDNIEVVKK